MRLLLDTHVWVWSQEHPEKLGRRTGRLLVAVEHVNAVCPVSSLEIARLVAVGEIALSVPLGRWIEESLAELEAETVPITHEVALEAYASPGRFHQDPADRLTGRRRPLPRADGRHRRRENPRLPGCAVPRRQKATSAAP